MKLKKLFAGGLACTLLLQVPSAFAEDALGEVYTKEDVESIYSKVTYSAGQDDALHKAWNTFYAKYPDDKGYVSGAAYYDDAMAVFAEGELAFSPTRIVSGEKEFDGVIFKSRSLAEKEAFEAVGCEVNFDSETMVVTISKGDNTIEIMPYLLEMRKNREDGAWVSLEICARYIGEENTLYIPVRDVCEELGIDVSWDNEAHCAVLK